MRSRSEDQGQLLVQGEYAPCSYMISAHAAVAAHFSLCGNVACDPSGSDFCCEVKYVLECTSFIECIFPLLYKLQTNDTNTAECSAKLGQGCCSFYCWTFRNNARGCFPIIELFMHPLKKGPLSLATITTKEGVSSIAHPLRQSLNPQCPPPT